MKLNKVAHDRNVFTRYSCKTFVKICDARREKQGMPDIDIYQCRDCRGVNPGGMNNFLLATRCASDIMSRLFIKHVSSCLLVAVHCAFAVSGREQPVVLPAYMRLGIKSRSLVDPYQGS